MKSKQLKDGSIVSRLETLALEVLVDHPDQKTYFRDYGAFEYETLKKDIKANGVKNPPDVLPPKNKAGLKAYTILSGHTRRNILLELGHTTAKILVRYDLINASRAEIDRAFLLDNVARRQQDRLGQTRAAVGLFRLEKEQRKLSTVSSLLDNGELRDQIGKIVDMSGRNLARYFHVLSAPIEVQDAFAAKKLTLIQAARVGGAVSRIRVRSRCPMRRPAISSGRFRRPCRSPVRNRRETATRAKVAETRSVKKVEKRISPQNERP